MAPDNLLYYYQTLLTGLLAVGAGAGAVWTGQGQVRAARAQITAARQQANLDRAARLRAARATLPATLSSLCEYAQSVGQILYSAWPIAVKLYPQSHSGTHAQRITVSIPPFPVELLGSLERVVELTEAKDVAERIESLLREAQIISARTRPLEQGADDSTDELAALIIQAAAIYARAESLFTYARQKTKGVNTADLWERVSAALMIMQIREPGVLEMVKRQRDRAISPGEADREEPD